MDEDHPISFLEINGMVLSGEQYEEYCKDHGLCHRCAKVKTHRRVVKMFGRGRKWEPITSYDDLTGEYSVYKGFCLSPNCYTLGQAKRLLGESGGARRSSSNGRSGLGSRLKAARRPSRRKARTNPETGSVMSKMDDDMSIASDMSGMSARSGASVMSGMSNLSGLSGLAGFRRSKRKGKRSSMGSTASSVSSGLSSMEDDDDTDDNISVDTTLTKDMNPAVADGEVNPIVAHRVEQLTRYDYFTLLDLSKVNLRPEDVEAIVKGIANVGTLEGIILDKCKLRDNDVAKIMEAIYTGGNINMKRISLRQNNIGMGVESMVPLLRESPTLEELDLSENAITGRGVGMIMDALLKNPKCTLHTLNLAQNEIWDLGGSEFLLRTTTLKVLNLDGNFLHDEGAGILAGLIAANRSTVLEKVFLGWNGIADDGSSALAKMLEVNSTIKVLGLAENDVTNIGARALLSALSINCNIREISGLYHNQIDRKFIIVAIKRLLHSHDRGKEVKAVGVVSPTAEKEQPEESKLPEGDDDGSDASTNWASQMFVAPIEDSAPGVAIEAMEQWDWGTLGFDEIEMSMRSNRAAVPAPMPDVTDSDDGEELPSQEAVPAASTLIKSRVTIFRSAPLAYFDRKTSQHHNVPLIDFESEKNALDELFKNHDDLGADVELVQEIATEDNVMEFFSRRLGPVMHYVGHGHPNCLALENGFGYLHALSRDALQNMILLNNGRTKVVVVSAVHALNTANVFLSAGVHHVVCCQRETAFADDGSLEFMKALYASLARNRTLKEAFDDGVEAAKRSLPNVLTAKAAARFSLLPKKPASSGHHNVSVMFENKWQRRPALVTPGDTSMLPLVPKNFTGREVDMYEILESLRVDDVVRIGGGDGLGKKTLLSAVSRYLLERPTTFGIGAVYWLPPPPDVFPDEGTCYGDLAQVIDLLTEAEDDLWDEDLYAECRERILVELENQRTVLVLDGRVFDTEAAGENLERFLSYLLNEVSIKIILINAHGGSARTKRSRSEETMVTMGPLDFKATTRLFGQSCLNISSAGNQMAYTGEEFYDIMVPPSARTQGADDKCLSLRQKELYDRIGGGNPKRILEIAESMSSKDLVDFLKLAQRPEIQVKTSEALNMLRRKFVTQQEKAIQDKNFSRAQDLASTLEELELLRKKFPNEESLAEKEISLKNEYFELLKAKKYDEATKVKQKILELKRVMLKEKFSKPNGNAAGASSTPSSTNTIPAQPTSAKLKELQARMEAMKIASRQIKLNHKDRSDVTFIIPQSNGGEGTESACQFRISHHEIVNYHPVDGSMPGILCWTNESCDLAFNGGGDEGEAAGSASSAQSSVGQLLCQAAGPNLVDDLQEMDILMTTQWGPVKRRMGEAELFGPSTYSALSARFILLAISPLSCLKKNSDTFYDSLDTTMVEDEDQIHHMEITLRTTYRSSFRLIRKSGMDALGVPMISTKEGGKMYQRTLQLGLETMIEEIKTCHKLNHIHVMASSEMEAKLLIKLAMACGLGDVGVEKQ